MLSHRLELPLGVYRPGVPLLLSSVLDLVEEQVSEQEGAKVVGALHNLKALLCAVVLHQKDASIVHQNIHHLIPLVNLGTELLD